MKDANELAVEIDFIADQIARAMERPPLAAGVSIDAAARRLREVSRDVRTLAGASPWVESLRAEGAGR